jgi:hypothetical protein
LREIELATQSSVLPINANLRGSTCCRTGQPINIDRTAQPINIDRTAQPININGTTSQPANINLRDGTCYRTGQLTNVNSRGIQPPA